MRLLHSFFSTVRAVGTKTKKRRGSGGRARSAVLLLENLESRWVPTSIAEYALQPVTEIPAGLTAGPDGNFWFTASSKTGSSGAEIGNITPQGAFNSTLPGSSPVALSNPDANPLGITSDGTNLWFTEFNTNKIGEISPTTGAILGEFSVATAATPNPGPVDIVADSSGNLWFTEQTANQIGEFNPTTGVVTEFKGLTAPPLGAGPNLEGILATKNGIWFSEFDNAKIGVIPFATGTVTEFSLAAGATPGGLTLGSDGNIWFTDNVNDKVGFIHTDGTGLTEFSVGTANDLPTSITTGPDGNLYYTLQASNKIGVITTAGNIIFTESVPTAASLPGSITNGPNGSMGFLEGANSNVAVLGAATSTALTATPNPSTADNGAASTVTLTATVTPFFRVTAGSPPTPITPTGTVQFFDGGTPLGSPVTISPTGLAILDVPSSGVNAFTVGTHDLTAVYSGDTNFATSTSPTVPEVVVEATATTVTGTPNPAVTSTATPPTVTFTATVTPTVAQAGLTPTGTVRFFDGTTSIGVEPVAANGTAILSDSSLGFGTHAITAVYSGDSNFAASTSPVFNEDVQESTSTTETASPNPAPAGTPVTFTATVTPATPIAGVAATGTVQFLIDGTVVGSAALGSGGTASFTDSNITPGPHTFSAVYLGDSDYAGSTSTPGSLAVTSTTTTTLSSNLNPSLQDCGTFTLTATVSSNVTSSLSPTGTVTFFNGSTSIGTATVTNGIATLSIDTTTGTFDVPGTYTLTAVYSGDSTFKTSTSAPLTETVEDKDTVLINAYYRDLFHRAADPGGFDFWKGLLDEGVPAYNVALGMMNTTEYRIDVVTAMYQKFLHRDPDAVGLAGWVRFITPIGETAPDGTPGDGGRQEQLIGIFLGSSEYFLVRAQDNLTNWLNQAYLDLLGRPIDPDGLSFWTAALTAQPVSASRQDVGYGIVSSIEGRTDAVNGFYNTFLHRAGDPGGLTTYVNLLNFVYDTPFGLIPGKLQMQLATNDPYDLVIASMISGTEYCMDQAGNAGLGQPPAGA